MIRMAGHWLKSEGRPHTVRDCGETVCLVNRYGTLVRSGQEHGGHAICKCGEVGPHVWSNRERQEWHRLHKQEVHDRMVRRALEMADD